MSILKLQICSIENNLKKVLKYLTSAYFSVIMLKMDKYGKTKKERITNS